MSRKHQIRNHDRISSLLRRAAPEDVPEPVAPVVEPEAIADAPADPVVQPGVLRTKVREYAALHRDEVYRSEVPLPERFRDLKTIAGKINMQDFLVPKLLSGSNFSGSSVHVSNYDVFLREFRDIAGVHTIVGGHDAFGIALRLDSITEEIYDALSKLDEYPSLDDDATGEVEREAIQEAWRDWARFDFLRALEEAFSEDEADIDALDDDQLQALFEILKARANAEWVHETGNRAYIDIARIVATATAADLPKVEHVELEPEPEGEEV
jgi:hypothetical protein